MIYFFQKKFTLLISFSFITAFLFAQYPASKWFQIGAGASENVTNSMTFDKNSEYLYNGGSFQGTMNFYGDSSVTITSSHSFDGYVSKYDTLGNIQNVIQYAGSDNQDILDVGVDDDNNLFVAGYFEDLVDFDPGNGNFQMLATDYKNAFVSKLNEDGDFIWAKQFECDSFSYVNSIAADDLGNLYVSGVFLGTADFDPGIGVESLTSSEEGLGGDLFVLKLDAQGEFLWVNRYEGFDFSYVDIDIAVDSHNELVVTGGFVDSVDFNAGPGVYPFIAGNYGPDIFVLKLKINGDFRWAKQIGGFYMDMTTSIAIDIYDNIYLTGSFQGTCDFDPSDGVVNLVAQSNFEQDAFVCKLIWNGDLAWAKQIKGFGVQEGAVVTVDDSLNVYSTGFFMTSADFNPHPTVGWGIGSNGFDDVYVQKLDINGDFRWARGIGGTFSDRSTGLVVDDRHNVYVSGNFSTTCYLDLDDDIQLGTSLGYRDVFIHQWAQLDTIPAVPEEPVDTLFLEELDWKLSIYPNPVYDDLNIQFDQEMLQVSMNVYNQLGQVITRKIFNDIKEIRTAIEGAPGVYIVELIAENRLSKRLKVVKL